MSASKLILAATAVTTVALAFWISTLSSEQHLIHTTISPQDHALLNTQFDYALFPNIFRTSDGLNLHVRRWLIPNPQGIVFLIHGYTEHSGRYEHLALDYNRLGLSVVAFDAQGHGGSQGDKNYIGAFDHLIQHVAEFMNHEFDGIQQRRGLWGLDAFASDSPKDFQRLRQNVFIFGHSMGGLIGFRMGIYFYEYPYAVPALLQNENYATRQPILGHLEQPKENDINYPQHPAQYAPRFMLSAPALALDKSLTDLPLLLRIADYISAWLPKLTVQSMPGDKPLSTNRVVDLTTRSDPLINPQFVLARFGVEFLRAIEFSHQHAANFTYPLLIFHSPDDYIVDYSGSVDVMGEIISTDKELYAVGGYHEITTDLSRPQIISKLNQWVPEHLHKSTGQ